MIRNAAAKMAPDMKNVVALPVEKARLRKSRSGTSGWAARVSQARNASSSRDPASSVARISGLDQPASFARTSAHTIATTPAVRSVTPVRSRRSGAPWLSGSSRAARATAIRPTGTLSQKIQCQSSPSVTAPPTSGPAATASPARPP